jgi:hypothetical protein
MNDLPPSNGKPKRWPVVAKMNGYDDIRLLPEPEYCGQYLPNDVIIDEYGIVWRWVDNHNGSRLRAEDITRQYKEQHCPELAEAAEYDATVEGLRYG